MTHQFILHIIQLILVCLIGWMLFIIWRYARRHHINLKEKFFLGFLIGYVTDLLDTLGIGTFATTTMFFKKMKLVRDDRYIPATMTTAHIIPVMVEALLFISIVQIDLVTLLSMATSAFLGASVGARITKNWNTQKVQRVLGVLLTVAALFMLYRIVSNPGANLDVAVRGLTGVRLVVGIIFDFFVGILMSMGLGIMLQN